MKSLCLILLLALCTPACSNFTAGGRQERAYAKYQKKLKAPRESRLAKLPRYFTAGGRQERAYAKYRKKLQVTRERRLAKLHRTGSEKPPPEVMASSEPREATETSDSPEAVPSELNGE
ncbi:MAG TPA: hypothetical protein VGW39_17785 [Chthoniobacterales bacterium]|nr:hypothetical protein [Chthoniobacterales bacterium]